jgi:hypothetical protein
MEPGIGLSVPTPAAQTVSLLCYVNYYRHVRRQRLTILDPGTQVPSPDRATSVAAGGASLMLPDGGAGEQGRAAEVRVRQTPVWLREGAASIPWSELTADAPTVDCGIMASPPA